MALTPGARVRACQLFADEQPLSVVLNWTADVKR
jgi:hypothetical protein